MYNVFFDGDSVEFHMTLSKNASLRSFGPKTVLVT